MFETQKKLKKIKVTSLIKTITAVERLRIMCVCVLIIRGVNQADERDESEIIVADGVVHLYYQSLQLPT